MSRSHRAVTATMLVLCALGVGPAVASAAGHPRDIALAKRIVLRVTDLSAGWSGKPNTENVRCFTRALTAGSTAVAASQRLMDGADLVEASGMVSAYPTAVAARHALTITAGPAPTACYHAALPALFAKQGITMTRFDSTPLAFAPLGDRLTASRYLVAVRKGQATGTIDIDFVFVVRGRFLITTGFVDQGVRPDVAGEHAAIAKAVARVPA